MEVKMNELALFAGAGGGILGGKLLGWRTVCAVEWEPYAASVLIARQNDGILPPFPIWDDVQTFDGKPWRGRVDVVSGGFPCQDISCAGKGAGIEGARSGMWKHMALIIGEVRPRFVFVENSPTLLVRGMGDVLGDLAALGYDAQWGVLGAGSCGGPIERERVWVAGSNEKHGETRMGNIKHQAAVLSDSRSKCPSFWLQAPPVTIGMDDGMDSYVDQVSAIGNGQVPAVVRLAWETLTEGHK
jgi:DNA (cytosine-5)-methyltransferase 1